MNHPFRKTHSIQSRKARYTKNIEEAPEPWSYFTYQTKFIASLPPVCSFWQSTTLSFVDSLNKKRITIINGMELKWRIRYVNKKNLARNRIPAVFRVTWGLLITLFPFVTYWKITLLISLLSIPCMFLIILFFSSYYC